MKTLNISTLNARIAEVFGEEEAVLVLTHFIEGVLGNTGVTFHQSCTHVMTSKYQLLISLLELNTANLISELVMGLTNLQTTDIIFSWQLRHGVLYFNTGGSQ